MKDKSQIINDEHITWTQKPAFLSNMEWIHSLHIIKRSHDIKPGNKYYHDILLMNKVVNGEYVAPAAKHPHHIPKPTPKPKPKVQPRSKHHHKHHTHMHKHIDMNQLIQNIKHEAAVLYKKIEGPITHTEAVQILQHMQKEQKIIDNYRNHLRDVEDVVIMNWSENDLYDSNNQLIDNKNLASWRTLGCKVYGKNTNDNAENDYDNRGYFAHYNYPVNIIKNPQIYYFNHKELKDLYARIKAHNPHLGKYLVRMARDGTIPVHKFKTLFGLSAKQVKARIQKAKEAAINSEPDPTISSLQKYYQWLLRQRRNYVQDHQDLSAYDSDYSDEFSDDIDNYHNPQGNDEDTNPENYNNMNDNFQTYTDSDIEAGVEYANPSDSDTQNGDV